jgi:hypothetical protein
LVGGQCDQQQQQQQQIFAHTEKLAPTEKVGALATLGLAQFALTQCVRAYTSFKKLPSD